MKLKEGIVQVALKDLDTNLFVRALLNDEHVLYLAELIEGGTKLPPIQITPDGRVIDGRHRVEAYVLNDMAIIEATVRDISGLDLIVEAHNANVGGSLPPTTQDLEKVVKQMMDAKASIKETSKLLHIPPDIVRRYRRTIQSKIARAKMQRAKMDVLSSNISVARAAEKHGVELQKLREALGGKKPRRVSIFADLQLRINTVHRSFGQTQAAILRKVSEFYEDGELSRNQVEELLQSMKKFNNKNGRSIDDRKKRIFSVEE